MIDFKNPTRESGHSDRVALAALAIAFCAALLMGAATALTPATTTSGVSTGTYGGTTAYFPDQFVNQAREIEPMPEMYY